MLQVLISFAALFLPWPLRRLVLVHVLRHSIDKTARIGFSLICSKHLEMGPASRVGHLTFCKAGVELVRLGQNAILGNLNWIGAVPLSTGSHFKAETGRRTELIVEDHAAITNRHFIDCTATVKVGRFSTVAGVHSVILTHSIDLKACKQRANSVAIGEYCFVGAACVVLAGTALPDFSVLGANSLLNKVHTEPYHLYAGSPARPVKRLSSEDGYFTRTTGFVD